MPITPRAAILAVRSVYAQLAQRPLQRACTGLAVCCRFHLTGRTPYLTRGEALLAAAAWRAAGHKTVPRPAHGSCPFLASNGRCQIYEGRPFGCRTHFCTAAGGPYPRSEVRDFIGQLETIDCQLGGTGAVNLPVALEHAMAATSQRKNR